MITVSTLYTDDFASELLISRWTTAEDQANAERRTNPDVKQNFLAARATMRALLARVTGFSDWRILSSISGKPEVFSLSRKPAPYISISHTRGLVACATSLNSPIGIDVEHWRERDFTALAGYAYGPLEAEAVAKKGMSAFYRIWTLREAIAKAEGNSVLRFMDGGDYAVAPHTSLTSQEAFVSRDWRLFHAVLRPKFSLALATSNRNIWDANNITWVDPTAGLDLAAGL
jgi:phosphopantetheinyl transferase